MSDKVDGQNEQVCESMKLIQRGHNRDREREKETEIQKIFLQYTISLSAWPLSVTKAQSR